MGEEGRIARLLHLTTSDRIARIPLMHYNNATI
jgi:hypothetical protein